MRGRENDRAQSRWRIDAIASTRSPSKLNCDSQSAGEVKLFSRDWLLDRVKIEICVEQDRTESIAAAVLDTARSGSRHDGIVAILPVKKVHNIRTRVEETFNRIRR